MKKISANVGFFMKKMPILYIKSWFEFNGTTVKTVDESF
jgi:hypothetical protein